MLDPGIMSCFQSKSQKGNFGRRDEYIQDVEGEQAGSAWHSPLAVRASLASIVATTVDRNATRELHAGASTGREAAREPGKPDRPARD